MARSLRSIAIAVLILLFCGNASAAINLSPEARSHFEAGIAYVDDPNGSNWEDALKEFRAAHELSHAWQMLTNIGLCALNLERDGEAIAAYKEYLTHSRDKDFSARQRKQIESDVAMLSASLVEVTVEVEPAEAVVTDERRNSKGNLVVNHYVIKDGRSTIGLHPGLHKLTVQSQGYVDAEWSFNADPGSTHQHRFKLDSSKKEETAPAALPERAAAKPSEAAEPPETSPRNTPTGVYVGLATTGALVAAATVTGIIALDKDSSFNQATDPAQADRLKSTGKTFALVTDIELGAAVVSAGITAYLYFTAPKKRTESKGPLSGRSREKRPYASKACAFDNATHPAVSSGLRLQPLIGAHAAGLGFGGRF
ncbi:MAG TPA: hypothetical protein VIV60_22835 [Polyangiaceae bacterium]